MTDIYLHFLCTHYGLYGNAPVVADEGLNDALPIFASTQHSFDLSMSTVNSGGKVRVRLKIIRNARIKTVGKYWSRMVSNVLILSKRTRTLVCDESCR